MLHAYQPKLSGNFVGVVFGSFAPLHQGHLELIMRAKKQCDGGCLVISCGYDGDKGEPLMPHTKRYRYVREFFNDDPKVAVYSINDTEIHAKSYPNGWDTWLEEFNRIWNKAVENPGSTKRIWYVGDKNYYEDLRFFKEDVHLINRSDNPICATMIRNNPIKHWDQITTPFRRVFSHNILITGTASEGKSTLVQDLGKYFNAPCSHEWARDYMEESCVADWELDGADFCAFLEGQYNLNKTLINSSGNHGIFFADTDSLVTKMYAEKYAEEDNCKLTMKEYQSSVAPLADSLAAKSRWDKVFCLVPGNIFVDDHTRFMQHSELGQREILLNKLITFLKQHNLYEKTTFLIGGKYWENFETIVNYVNEVMKGTNHND